MPALPWSAWLGWLERSAVGTALRESVWLYPGVEIVHIVSFAVLVGAAVLFDLRLLGLSRGVSVQALAGHLLPFARLGLAVAAPTGVLLFIADATALSGNPAFRIKLALIALAILNTVIFHRWTARSMSAWDIGQPTPLGAKLAGVVSLVLWTAVVAGGRLIAYV
jgi:hypothetical protein